MPSQQRASGFGHCRTSGAKRSWPTPVARKNRPYAHQSSPVRRRCRRGARSRTATDSTAAAGAAYHAIGRRARRGGGAAARGERAAGHGSGPLRRRLRCAGLRFGAWQVVLTLRLPTCLLALDLAAWSRALTWRFDGLQRLTGFFGFFVDARLIGGAGRGSPAAERWAPRRLASPTAGRRARCRGRSCRRRRARGRVNSAPAGWFLHGSALTGWSRPAVVADGELGHHVVVLVNQVVAVHHVLARAGSRTS